MERSLKMWPSSFQLAICMSLPGHEAAVPDHHDLLNIVSALEDAANHHAIDEGMAWFADDAEFEPVGLARLIGKEQTRSIFEYDAGVDGNIPFINCTLTGETVPCTHVETNDRIRLAGVNRLAYPTCKLTFENGLIRSWLAVGDPCVSGTPLKL